MCFPKTLAPALILRAGPFNSAPSEGTLLDPRMTTTLGPAPDRTICSITAGVLFIVGHIANFFRCPNQVRMGSSNGAII